jgi:RNA polymerase sigma-70 factor (ECF subfamily)
MAEGSAARCTADDSQPRTACQVDLAGLVASHHAVVYRYACRLCGCPTEAEDLTQQAFLIAQQKLHQLRDSERAGGWLLAVVRSCFLKSLRKSRQTTALEMGRMVENIADQTSEVEQIDREELAAALAELPDEFRLVVLMFYFEDLSYQQIAEQLEVPIGTVMSRLSRAKGHLRRRLALAEPQPEFPRPETQPTKHHFDLTKRGGDSIVGLRAAP